MPRFLFLLNITATLIFYTTISAASVPPSATFKLTNTGTFGDYITEYNANYRTLNIFTSPFQLCFYNTTPDTYTLALRMGLVRSESLFRWVWEANRNNPVKENATLTLGVDGNLVLAEADGRVAWQTGTAKRGVVGFKLLPNGNMILHDVNGKFVWQSFDYPTDTLLVGQYLSSVNGPRKLVSRKSAKVNADGVYSLVLESKTRRVAMYYDSTPNNNLSQMYYAINDVVVSSTDGLKSLTFESIPEGDGDDDDSKPSPYAWNLVFATTDGGGSTLLQIARPKYNATASFLRLGLDGNLKVYTYNDKVDWGAWEVTFTLFARESPYALWDTECQLPEKCGEFGVCDEDSQCVACPTAPGGLLLGWSKGCRPPKVVTGCKGGASRYYKVDGVDHFTSKYMDGIGPVKERECGDRCSKDCKCLGWFYNRDTSKCWIAYDLKTLIKVGNDSHIGYIKM